MEEACLIGLSDAGHAVEQLGVGGLRAGRSGGADGINLLRRRWAGRNPPPLVIPAAAAATTALVIGLRIRRGVGGGPRTAAASAAGQYICTASAAGRHRRANAAPPAAAILLECRAEPPYWEGLGALDLPQLLHMWGKGDVGDAEAMRLVPGRGLQALDVPQRQHLQGLKERMADMQKGRAFSMSTYGLVPPT